MQQSTASSRLFSLLLVCGTLAFVGVPRPHMMQRSLEARPAIAASGSTPRVCLGYNSTTGRWGEEFQLCPAGHAAYGVADAGGKERAGEKIPAVQVCCPLPAPDILTHEEVYVRE